MGERMAPRVPLSVRLGQRPRYRYSTFLLCWFAESTGSL